MAESPSDPAPSDYRLAPALGARLVGGLFVGLAVLMFVATAAVLALGLPADLLIVLAAVGVAATLVTGYALTRRVVVLHLGAEGYRVRLVRGAGVSAARWKEVDEAVTASPQGEPVVVLKLGDGRTTTIPVRVLDVDREQFVRDLRAHLQHGQGLRPL